MLQCVHILDPMIKPAQSFTIFVLLILYIVELEQMAPESISQESAKLAKTHQLFTILILHALKLHSFVITKTHARDITQ